MDVLQLVSLLALGLGIGGFGTLLGVGGGFLAVPLLIIVYGFEPRIAVGTSLVFVFFNALSGSLAYLRQRRVDTRTGLMFAAATLPGSVLGAYTTTYLGSGVFNVVFSALLIAASIYLVARPLRGQHHAVPDGYHRRIVDRQGNVYVYRVKLVWGLPISLGVGFVSSIFGVGGGIIHVPAMILLLGFPTHVSTATSFFILTFSSFIGSATHASLSNVKVDVAVPLVAGALLGAQVGALISRRIAGTVIERLFGLALVIVALRLLFEAF